MPSAHESPPSGRARSKRPLAIAIVGRACTLPGALTPEELWRGVESGSDQVGAAPTDRWTDPASGLDARRFLGSPQESSSDRAWSDRGGYVRGFDQVFDPEGFCLPAERILNLDPLFQWTLHTARRALEDAGLGAGDARRSGAIFGNLSFPSAAMARFAESVWRGRPPKVDPRNRFCSGLPALILRQALDLDAGAFALDAACASSLYAIKSACDWLNEGRADVMLAGAVNCTDDLFIHIGFSALSALSPSGRSRPFHSRADGLIPAEGAAFVTLRRLEDAERDGDRIHGVIRGIGLSNDGRGRGFLVPASEGQVRAMRAAYAESGLEPSQIDLVECHATGTAVGDATELRSLAEVFGDRLEADVPVGSLKSNLGHLITAAGVAGLIKVTEAMAAGVRPPTLHVDEPLAEFERCHFRPLLEAEPWTTSGAPRRAAVSAFGFGGNNAHLIVEQWSSDSSAERGGGAPRRASIRVATDHEKASDGERPEIAIVGIGIVAAGCSDSYQFAEALLSGERRLTPVIDGGLAGRIDRFAVELTEVGIPPNDLPVTLAQQLLLLEAGSQAASEVEALDRERSGVFVGMGVDGEVARYGARWRLGEWLETPDPATLEAVRSRIVGPLVSSGVIGTMPNIVANRLNRRLDLAGASCTVSAEERSGLEALDLAWQALGRHELDAAIVGAVDLSCEPVHRAAAELCLPANRQIPGDAAVAVVVKRLDDAEASGDRIYATISHPSLTTDSDASPTWGPDDDQITLTPRFGHAHAASGLLHLAAAALSLHHRVSPNGAPILSASDRRAIVRVAPMSGSVTRYQPPEDAAWRLDSRTRSTASSSALSGTLFHCYEGRDRSELIEALESGTTAAIAGGSSRPRGAHPRLMIVAGDRETLARRIERARKHLANGAPAGAGVHLRMEPVEGEVAFVFASAGTGYRGMGRDLLRALPELGDRLEARFGDLEPSLSWALRNGSEEARDPTNTERLWGASALCRLHTELTRSLLGIEPHAAIGYSSGESTSLFALGAWSDIGAMRADIERHGLFDPALGGTFEAVARAWGTDQPVDWAVWNVLDDVDRVRALLENETRLHLAIVHTDRNCVVAGDAQAAARLVETIGPQRCQRLDYDIAAHVPEVQAFREPWLEIHRRKVTPPPGIRFYSAGHDGAYEPSTEASAQAILGQAITTLDFPSVIERAYQDGVRIFIEHGPQSSCASWIREILGERSENCAVVALDRSASGRGKEPLNHDSLSKDSLSKDSLSKDPLSNDPLGNDPLGNDPLGNGVAPALEATAALLAAGLPFDPRPLERALVQGLARNHLPLVLEREVGSRARPVPLAAHPAPVSLPPEGSELMAPAPALPSILDETGLPVATEPFLPIAAEPFPPEREPAVVTGSSVALTAVAPPPEMTSRLPALIAGQKQAWRAQLEILRQVHQQFVEQQARVHERFLATRYPSLSTVSPPPSPVPSLRSEPTPVPPPAPTPAPTPIPDLPRPQATPALPDRIPPAREEASAPDIGRASDAPAPGRSPVGLRLDHRGLLVHASGRISQIFGPLFEQQDAYPRQVRMPEPPLLLADRMTGLDAEPAVQGTGTIWTETDVREDSWYLHRGRMPAGILIESGQADLMLISYMGADLTNRSERVYRLLGCVLTFLDDLPRPGDTLSYQIEVDGHAEQDGVRLFFFHYDCTVNGKPRIQVRSGQAGFFTDAELAKSAGILWSAEEAEPCPEPRLDPPPATPSERSFDAQRIQAFAEGQPWDCFGDDYDLARTHTRTPTIQTGDMLFLDRVTDFDPVAGGPWKRGYLRAEADVSPDDWFFAGHFKNDPCMPGTLMFEGCVQALAFTMAGMGLTLRHDGWRFQPVTGEPIEMRCRGQVTPSSKTLSYEVFVEEVIAGPIPTLYADLLCTVDGLKAFHARRVGLQLVPDWPLESEPQLLEQSIAEAERHPGARRSPALARVPLDSGGSLELGYASLLACAWGRPSNAFGPLYERFDGPTRVPRLPGPPYHFVSRVLAVNGEIGRMQTGSTVEVEYDVPPDAWYFDDNGARTMPFAVLLEAALQPCGWLASYVGSALTVDEELAFRNLDGTGTLFEEVLDGTGGEASTLRTRVKLNNISRSAGMIIVGFDVECLLEERRIYEMSTVFGFFPPAALASQIGQPTTDEQRAELEEESDFLVDLTDRPARFCSGTLRLGEGRLRMLDRVTGLWREGGARGLGRARAERSVDADDWYFKAHFFQDPVQPGSLGIEAMIQLLQFAMIELDLAQDIDSPRFEPLALGHALTWKYRGQVIPSNERIQVTLEITEIVRDGGSVSAFADASLWCDGIRIYSAQNLGMRIVSGAPASERERPPGTEVEAPAAHRLDPEVDTWLLDHRPTWSRPALPMMSVVDLLASAVPREPDGSPRVIRSVRDVQVSGWLDFPSRSARTFRTAVERGEETGGTVQWQVELFSVVEGGSEERAASARIFTGPWEAPPEPLAPVEGAALEDPYAAGHLFHGPAFQLLIGGALSESGASTRLRASSEVAKPVPLGCLNPALLDAALHGIPHDRLHLWSPEIGADRVAYPTRISELALFGPTPTRGELRCEVRFDGFLMAPDLPRFVVQLITTTGGRERVWAEMTLIEACFPKGPLGSAPPQERRQFLRDHRYVEGLSLSRREDVRTVLDSDDVESCDWMPGTVEAIYGTRDPEQIAIKEHHARREHLHPRILPQALPLHRLEARASRENGRIVVEPIESELAESDRALDLGPVTHYWRKRLGYRGPWLGQDLVEGLIERYVGRVVLEDPESFEALRGRSAIFVGNHQVQIESILITHLLAGLTALDVVTMANAKHEARWIGWLIDRLASYPGLDPEADPFEPIVYFDQARPDALLDILAELGPRLRAGECSFFFHAAGTRSRVAADPVTRLSSVFLDLAIEHDLPMVPVRFLGGLPSEPIEGKLEFPTGHAKQDYVIGRPIDAQELRALPYGQRRARVLEALNQLGSRADEPGAPDPGFQARIEEWSALSGVGEVEATLLRTLEEIDRPCAETSRLLDALGSDELSWGDSERERWLLEVARRLSGDRSS